MNVASITLRLAAGLALGAFFYGTLWMTVRRLPAARHPVLLAVGSFWARLIVVLAGFFVLMRGRWEYAAMCLAGFMAGRLLVSRLLGAKPFTAGNAESAGDAEKAKNWNKEEIKKSALIRANPR